MKGTADVNEGYYTRDKVEGGGNRRFAGTRGRDQWIQAHKLAPFLTQRLVLAGLRCLVRRWKLLLDYRQMVEVRLQEKLLKVQSRAPIAPLTPISWDSRRLPTAA